jgi:hypothetical protein
MDGTVTDYLVANKLDAITDLRAIFGKKLELGVDAVLATKPLHPAVQATLNTGDLLSALRMLAASNKGATSKVANSLANALGNTKLKVVDGLKNDAGQPVAGLFDPKTNTIQLDAELGMTPHTLFHETTHALTAATLANKSHPVTRQLNDLFQTIKASLDGAYGAQSLEEFVAEAFSNPEFQAKLRAINPKGEPITAWQKFSHTIKNMLRRVLGLESKPMESALDKTDTLIESILAPSPDSRNAGVLYQAALTGSGDKVLDRVAAAAAKLPLMNQDRADVAHELISTTLPTAAKKGLLKLYPLHALVEIAKPSVARADQLLTLVKEKRGAEGIRNQKIEATIAVVKDWAKKNPSLIDSLNKVVYDSTVEQVDPSKPASEYKGDKLNKWKELQPEWNKLQSSGQGIYTLMRDTYKKMYKDTQTVLENRIDEMGVDKQTAEKLKKDFYEKLFENGVIEPYFPLTRTGKYWLSYHAYSPRTKTTELFVELFETPAARTRAIEDLKKQLPASQHSTIETFSKLEQINYRNAPPTSFVSSLLQTLEASKLKASADQKKALDESIQQVMTTFLNLLPETSFAQSFRHRKNREGYNRDAIGALETKGYSLSRQLTNIEYGAKLQQLRANILKDYKQAGNPESARPYIDELNTRIDFAISPQVPEWAQVATSLGFNMTLGLNVSSALVNLAQLPMVVYPYLSSKHGPVASFSALGRATRLFMGSGSTHEVEVLTGGRKHKFRAMPSLDNYDFSNEKVAHLKTLADEALRLGQLNRSATYDILDMDNKSTVGAKVNAVTGFVFHHGERMNRQIALIAAYELNLAKLKKAGKTGKTAELEAAQQAIYEVELTNGGTIAEAAPSIAQSGLGKVIFMYKNYGVSMMYMLFKAARDATKNADPDVRKQAMGQLAGVFGSAALFAGASGLPMYGVIAMLYNMFKDDDEEDFDTSMRKWLGETMFSGVLNAVTGLEISRRIGLANLIFRDTTVKDQDSAILSLMETLGGPVFGIVSRMERGVGLIGEGYTARGIEQMMPSAIGNMMKSTRYAAEGTQTLRGDPITGEVGPWNVGAQFFGFAPAEYIRQLEINAQEKGIQRSVNEERTKILRRYYMALRQGDADGLKDVGKELADFNKRHPSIAISGDTIKKSMAQHMRTSATMYHGITLDRRMLPEIRARLAEYEDTEDED